MLNVSPARFGRVDRRNFLRAGTLAVGGLTLADLFRLRGRGGNSGFIEAGQPRRPGC